MADKWSDQIRACGLFFISIVVLMIIPLVYHCFVFLTAVPLWSTQPASCVILLISFHVLFLLLIMSYWKTIFTDAGGVPYELDEAWVRLHNTPLCEPLSIPHLLSPKNPPAPRTFTWVRRTDRTMSLLADFGAESCQQIRTRG